MIIIIHHHTYCIQGDARGGKGGDGSIDAREEKKKEKEEFQKMWKSVMDLGKKSTIGKTEVDTPHKV